MEEKITYIYKLVDPREPEVVRYVGKADKPDKRLSSHISEAKSNRATTYRDMWIRSMLYESVVPICDILETVIYYVKDEWACREKYWISYFRELNHPLTNLTDGGDGNSGYKTSDETRLKQSIARTGTKRTEETKKKMSEAAKGRKQSEETKEKLRKINLGKTQSEESNRKRSETLKGRPVKGRKLTDEEKAAHSIRMMGHKGVVHTEETKEILRQANLGKTTPEDVKEKISKALKGRSRPPEVVAKIKESHRLRQIRLKELKGINE